MLRIIIASVVVVVLAVICYSIFGGGHKTELPARSADLAELKKENDEIKKQIAELQKASHTSAEKPITPKSEAPQTGGNLFHAAPTAPTPWSRTAVRPSPARIQEDPTELRKDIAALEKKISTDKYDLANCRRREREATDKYSMALAAMGSKMNLDAIAESEERLAQKVSELEIISPTPPPAPKVASQPTSRPASH